MVFLKMERWNNCVRTNAGYSLREKLRFGQENINKKEPAKSGLEYKKQIQ